MKKSSFNTFNTNVEKIHRITNSLEQKRDIEQLRYIRDGLYSIVGGGEENRKNRKNSVIIKAKKLFSAFKNPLSRQRSASSPTVSPAVSPSRQRSASSPAVSPAPKPAPVSSQSPVPASKTAPAIKPTPTPAPVSAPAVSTPSVSTPSVSTPSVSTPSVSTPSVSTPSVSTPSVSTPSVSTPSVSAPTPTPTPTPTPAVSVPAPPVSAPAPEAVQARQRSLSTPAVSAPVQARQRSATSHTLAPTTENIEVIDLNHFINCILKDNYQDFEKEFIKKVLNDIYIKLNNNKQIENKTYEKQIFLKGWKDNYKEYTKSINEIYNGMIKEFIDININNFTINNIKLTKKDETIYTITDYFSTTIKTKININKRYKDKIFAIISELAKPAEMIKYSCPTLL